jgi:arylsulfatase
MHEGYCTDVWFGLAENYVREHAGNRRPFFLYLATNCPHAPHWVDEVYSEPYRKLVRENVARFFGQIANIDENMGRLMKVLEETGLAGNTLLIFLTDNGSVRGSGVFNAGMRGKKRDLWEGGHRVPLFIRWPEGKIGPPRNIDQPAQVQDLLPTLADLCGLEVPARARLDGVSLAPLLRGERDTLEDRMLVVEYGDDHDPERSAVIWKKWRLVGYTRLYDLSKDPHQDHDLAEKYPDVVRAMQQHYDSWWEDAESGFRLPRYIRLGNPLQDPLMLYSSDWQGSFADNFTNLSAGDGTGYWDVIIERKGSYEFTLSRWHPESGIPMNASFSGPHGSGKAIPVAAAGLLAGDYDLTLPVESGEVTISFNVPLDTGKCRIGTRLLDPDGDVLCSAYYTNIKYTGE